MNPASRTASCPLPAEGGDRVPIASVESAPIFSGSTSPAPVRDRPPEAQLAAVADSEPGRKMPKIRKTASSPLRLHEKKGCIFCQIVHGRSPAQIVYKDEQCIAFHDKYPRAPWHLLVIPRKHLTNLNALKGEEGDKALIGHIMMTIPEIARQQGIDSYRTLTNTGAAAGQAVFHLHFHLTSRRAPFPGR